MSPPGTSGKNHSAPAEHGGTAIEDGGVLVSAYGSGPDSDAIQERAESMGLAVEFHPATDHAELFMYKTFVNPSESEVLCTTVAEALAMGKFVVIAEHASNEFFYQFPNTLKFKTHEEFKKQVQRENRGAAGRQGAALHAMLTPYCSAEREQHLFASSVGFGCSR